MADRKDDRKLETNGPGPLEPGPAPAPAKFPLPIPWISTEPSSQSPPGAGLYAPGAVMRAIHPGASTVSEPLLRPNSPEVSRHPALGRGFTVLLVDDNHHHRIPLLRALRERGHKVLHAADGPSGEALCRASQLGIDALVACADMKRMCGFELARRVGRMRPEVQVLLMWRHFERSEEAHRAYERGYAGIEEPFTPEQLCRRLTGLLASPRGTLTPQGAPSMKPQRNPGTFPDSGPEIVQEASSLVELLLVRAASRSLSTRDRGPPSVDCVGATSDPASPSAPVNLRVETV